MRELKAELSTRLRREGRWTDFVQRRERMKAAGVPAREAWREAAAAFPPAGQDQPPPKALIPWSQARRYVNAAEDDINWVVRAFDAEITPRVAERNATAYSILMAVRHHTSIREKFDAMLLERVCAASNPPKRA